jgi:hypothetical protein
MVFIGCHVSVHSFLFFFFSCGIGVWTQGFALVKLALYDVSHTPCPFCCSYFGDGVLRIICRGWPWTAILPFSASQVAGMTGVSTWLVLSFNQLSWENKHLCGMLQVLAACPPCCSSFVSLGTQWVCTSQPPSQSGGQCSWVWTMDWE